MSLSLHFLARLARDPPRWGVRGEQSLGSWWRSVGRALERKRGRSALRSDGATPDKTQGIIERSELRLPETQRQYGHLPLCQVACRS
ncbi:MAG: hypothetical protein EOM37_03990 [Proteobacteria bacterium]|nr:hypothetical protein [Alphaproteobacteria bacterium]NCC03196.1 hypothetical protein [Pseudomonadota bacterium]